MKTRSSITYVMEEQNIYKLRVCYIFLLAGVTYL